MGPTRECARVSLGKEESDVGSIEETFRRNPVGHRAHPVESGPVQVSVRRLDVLAGFLGVLVVGLVFGVADVRHAVMGMEHRGAVARIAGGGVTCRLHALWTCSRTVGASVAVGIGVGVRKGMKPVTDPGGGVGVLGGL
jgi:hypothetical protein